MPNRSRPSRVLVTCTLSLAVAAGCMSSGNVTTTGAAQPSAGATQTSQSSRFSPRVRSDAEILGSLHASNLGEITAAMQAQQTGTDSSVKSFAAQMMSEHSTMDQQGATLSQQIGVAPTLPDSSLPRLQQNELAALRAAGSGAGFDKLYISQQVVAHQRTLALVDASINVAQHAELKTMLQSQVRPAVAGHLAQAQQIQSRLGGQP